MAGILKQSVPVAYSAINATLGHYFGAGKRPVLKVRVPHTLDFSPPTTPPPEAADPATAHDPAHAPLGGPPRTAERAADEADDLDFDDDDDEARPPPVINVLLISEVDGRTTMVDLTKILTEMAQKGKLKPADVNADLIDMELRDSVMTEPELLILFGPRVVLDGYPPWQIRLTEILYVAPGCGVEMWESANLLQPCARPRRGRVLLRLHAGANALLDGADAARQVASAEEALIPFLASRR
jgi:dehydrodolichyl diphosphate syntase complex subunit NUS1